MFLTKRLGIDLGTSRLRIAVPGRGGQIVIDEPTVVTLSTQENAVLAAGSDAANMVGRAPESVSVINPMREGVIDDYRIVLPPKGEAMGSIDTMISHFKLVMEGVRVPAGETWYSIESSKGELGFGIISDGGTKPVRCRFRGPSFINIASLPELVKGELVADVVAINASLDVVLGEIDR